AASDPDPTDTLTYTAAGLPPGLTINPNTGLITGTVTYVASGSYAVTVTVTDDGTPVASATDTFTWTITPPVVSNQNPTALPDDIAGDDVTTISIDVLANDADPDGDEITLTSYGDATITQGILVDQGDGRFSYTPKSGTSYTEFFTYSVTDGWGGFASSTVTITITSAPASPAQPVADSAPPAVNDASEPLPTLPVVDAPARPPANQAVPGVIGGQGSAERKGSLVAELVDFQSGSTINIAEQRPIHRTLVVLGRVSLETFEALGPSAALLAGFLVVVVSFGRIGLFPFLKRSRRLSGVVVWLDNDSGYGFILPDRHQAEVFFHQTMIGRGDEVPAPGDQVSYRMVRGGRGDFAFRVKSVQTS
ncbi:MAG: Ig-like domain-containing protein, partial [Acidimicrobiia bacterium]|nr:Ig-like domain-containing protein [Acidimicrobiia bacterium]